MVSVCSHRILALEVDCPEFGMIIVAVLAAVETRVRVRVVDSVVLIVCREAPLDVQRW